MTSASEGEWAARLGLRLHLAGPSWVEEQGDGHRVVLEFQSGASGDVTLGWYDLRQAPTERPATGATVTGPGEMEIVRGGKLWTARYGGSVDPDVLTTGDYCYFTGFGII